MEKEKRITLTAKVLVSVIKEAKEVAYQDRTTVSSTVEKLLQENNKKRKRAKK